MGTMKFILILTVLLTAGQMSPAAGIDPVSLARGGTWLRSGGDPWLVLSCPPLLTALDEGVIAVAHSPGLFGLKELSRSTLALSLRSVWGGWGFALSHFGYTEYREFEFTAAFGAGTGLIRFGGACLVRRVQISRYGSAIVAELDAAIVAHPLRRLMWGVKLANLNRPALGSTGERQGPDVSVECTALPVDDIEITMHAGNEFDRPLTFRAGFSVRLVPQLTLMCGSSVEFSRLHAGFETEIGTFRFGYVITTHQALGWTHVLSLGADLP